MKHVNAGGRTFYIRYNTFKGTYEFGPFVHGQFVVYGTDDTEAECEKRILQEFGGRDYEEENH